MSIVHVSQIQIHKHRGPHRTARIGDFVEPVHFGIHGGIKQFYEDKYGSRIEGPEYPATLDFMIAAIAG